MDPNLTIHPGMNSEETVRVLELHLAPRAGSGDAPVLATPWMIAFMEGISFRLLATYLPEGYSSVGVHVDVRHLAPTPVNSQVKVRCQVLEVVGMRVTFQVEAWDESEKIGTGRHERAIIESRRFLERVVQKRQTRPLQGSFPEE